MARTSDTRSVALGCAAIFGLLFSIIGPIATMSLTFSWQSAAADARALDRAAPCDPTQLSAALTSSLDCVASVHGTVKGYGTDASPGCASSDCALTTIQLTVADGTPETASMPRGWTKVTVGTPVQASLWRGTLVAVTPQGAAQIATLNDPRIKASDGISALVFGLLTVLDWSALATAIVVYRRRRASG